MKLTGIVKTKYGDVRGYKEDGMEVYKGIPYASPPIKERRFMKPSPPEPWEGILKTVEFGPIVPQKVYYFTQKPHPPQSEADSLTLNIWTPSCDNRKRPVMLWIHGGGFTNGNASRPSFNGIHLAKRGELVVVSINYRLGIMGNLYVPRITSNAALLDQIASLKWVKENIEFFGGDPDSVTIFGNSAGGVSVCALMTMPGAKGLFQRAIAQSGALRENAFPVEIGKKNFNKLCGFLDLDPADPAEALKSIQTVPVEKMLELQDKMREDLGSFAPMADGTILPKNPLGIIRNGYAKDIDLLIGTNWNESSFFIPFRIGMAFASDDKIKQEEATYEKASNFISTALKRGSMEEDKILKFIDVYKNNRKNPGDMVDGFFTDFMFRIPSIKTAEAHSLNNENNNVFMYLFDYPSPLKNGDLGAIHTIENIFVFDTFGEFPLEIYPSTRTEEIEIISHKMMDSWISFARTGNPNCEVLPEWKPYDLKHRTTMIIGRECKSVEDPSGTEREVWG
ncbi:MAG: carboxylesterase/lipase family protein [Promethearchaeota archaeon]